MNKDYKTLILAALLHDIGKPLHFAQMNPDRAKEDKHRHPLYANDIFELLFFGKPIEWLENADALKRLKPLRMTATSFDWEKVATLVTRHHLHPEDFLETVIQAGDHFAASERTKKEEMDDPRQTVMESIFKDLYYQPRTLNIDDRLIPDDIEKPLNVEQLRTLCVYMLVDLRVILESWQTNTPDSPDTLLSHIDLWSYKYFWMWPSTRGKNDEKDISLYDHSRVATAIAACLYPQQEKLWLEKTKELKAQAQFQLIQGDFSGIQRYIFDITQKSAAKRLRSRSLYIQVLTENIANVLLNAFDLPSSCLLQNAGGKFMILVPAGQQAIFDTRRQQIESELFAKYRGEIGLNLILSEPFNGEKFKAPHWLSFIEKQKKAFQRNKFQPKRSRLVSKEQQWLSNDFVLSLEDNSAECKGCGKPHALNKEEHCSHCANDKANGRKLVDDAHYLAFTSKSESVIPTFSIIETLSKIISNQRITIINPQSLSKMQNITAQDCPLSLKFMANYIPVYTDTLNKELSDKQLKVLKHFEHAVNDDDRIEKGEPLHFKALAELADGKPMLGVLKMDVDSLGDFFREGIGKDRYTITRSVTASRLLDLFFSGYLDYWIRKKYPLTYVVYAGGDDVLSLGPWTEIIGLASDISEQFRLFTGGALTISAGISFVHASYPIKEAIYKAENELEKSKQFVRKDGSKKNAVTLWGNALSWDDLTKVREQAEKVVNWMKQEKDPLSTGFVRNLLSFSRMKKNGNKRYMPLLAYQISRHLKQDSPVRDWLTPMISEEKPSLLPLELIVTIALYRIRGNNE